MGIFNQLSAFSICSIFFLPFISNVLLLGMHSPENIINFDLLILLCSILELHNERIKLILINSFLRSKMNA